MNELYGLLVYLAACTSIVIISLSMWLYAYSMYTYIDHLYQKSKYVVKTKTKKHVRH